VPAQSKRSGTGVNKSVSERRLSRYLDWITYIICAALVGVIAWLAMTRAPTQFSFSGTSSLFSCEQLPAPTVSEGLKVVEYPHFHVPADSLIVTSTALRVTKDDEEASQADVSVPQSPQATAFIKFNSRYTVRLFMHEGNVLSILPGDRLAVASVKPWLSLRLPREYTVAFLFHYRGDAPLWKVVGTEKVDFTLRTSGFDTDQTLVKPIGERLQIAGIPHRFENAPVSLGCCSFEWPPLTGLRVTLKPDGQTADYESELFVHVRTDAKHFELVEAAPMICKSGGLVGAVGEISLTTGPQPLKNPGDLHVVGHFEVGVASEDDQVKYSITGTATSMAHGTNELVPTRLETIGPFWAGLLSTIAAAFVAALIATKGKMIRQWLHK
jgi:hypothetical protein